MDELDLITLHGHRMTALHQQEADGILRRSRSTTLHVLNRTQDENCRLIRENHRLAKEHERAVDLIRTLAHRSEAFRRLVVHLRDAWEPTNPGERPLKATLKPLLDAKKNEVANDATFVRTLNESIERLVDSGQGSEAQTNASFAVSPKKNPR